MANVGLQPLTAMRLTRVIQELQDVREMPQDLKFLGRTQVVNATDAEITERFIGRAQIADIIADDQAAATYSFGRFSNETVNIPNLKLGLNLTQSQINQINALAGAGVGADSPLLSLYSRWGESGLLGVRQRMESLLVAMATDAFAYDRLGVKLSGVTWGMPSDLKVTPSVAWDHTTSSVYDATPVTDVLTLLQVARQRYGEAYDRMTMSTTAFNYMTQTTEFINRVRVMYALNSSISAATIPTQNVQYMLTLAAPILGMKEIELYDARYWSQDTTGAVASTRFMPVNQVVLSSTQDDNNASVMDFANAITTESQVAGILPTNMIGELPAGQYGPISYATPTDANLNPPGITVWSVARGWPRKWRRAATAVMTVGTFSDAITVGVPFPVA